MTEEKVLQYCANLSETTGSDLPTAITRYIEARKGEIFEEKEKIRKARLKIKKIETEKNQAENALTNFWISEIDKRNYKNGERNGVGTGTA
jgi:hypothetical protein